MKLQDIMSGAGLSIYAEVSLMIFFGVFLGVAVDLWSSRGRAQAMSLLPLEDDTPARATRKPS